LSVINEPKSGKPVPSSKGVQDFIDKLCEENESVSIFKDNIVLFDPNLQHRNVEKHDYDKVMEKLRSLIPVEDTSNLFDASTILSGNIIFLNTIMQKFKEEISAKLLDGDY